MQLEAQKAQKAALTCTLTNPKTALRAPQSTSPDRLQHFPSHSRTSAPSASRKQTQLQTMGLSTLFSDIWDSFSHPAADAEAPPSSGTSTDEESGEEAEANKQDAKGDDGDEEQGQEPGDKDDEEEEEEVQDPKHRLEEGKLLL